MKQFYRSCVLQAVLVLCSGHAWALVPQDNIKEEARWSKWASAIAQKNRSLRLEESGLVRKSCVSTSCTTDFDIFLMALSDAFGSGVIKKAELKKWLQWSEKQPLAVEERAHLAWTFHKEFIGSWAIAKIKLLQAQEQKQLMGGELSPRFEQMLSYTNDGRKFAPIPPDANRVQLANDLVTKNPPIEKYGDGSYANGIRIYMFCRDDRHYPCLMVMRDTKGNLVKENGQYWTHKALGFARLEKEYDEVNGNTPAGVFLLDGVMPAADQPLLFGKYRRFVLNLPERSSDEEEFKKLLPVSSHTANWWKEGVIARNMGRGLFRVHGTGRPAPEGTTYFPFLGTGGCIAQRENRYNGVTYKDQRNLLDAAMEGMDLIPEFGNEPFIKGLLYVMNIDNSKRPVELADLLKLKVLR